MNKFIAIGRITNNIELKTTTSGKYVTNFGLAINRNFKNADGERESDFLNCVAFNKLAETISKYLKKGDLIGIEGSIQTRKYTDKDGNNRYATEVKIDNIDFLQPKRQDTDKKVDVDPFGDLEF